MQLLLGIQIDQEWCRIGFIQSDGYCGSVGMPVREEPYTSFYERVARKTLSLLSTSDGIRPVTAIGVVVEGTTHQNIILSSSALPFLVGKPLANDLGRELNLSGVPIGVIDNVVAALLGVRSDFNKPMRSVESAGALEFANTLVPTP